MAKRTEEAVRLTAVRAEQRRVNRSERNWTATRLRHALFPYALRKGSHKQSNTLDEYGRKPTLEPLGGPRSPLSEGVPSGTESARDTGQSVRCEGIHSEQE